MPFEQELDTYLRARFTLIVLMTTEEQRAVAEYQGGMRAHGKGVLDVGPGRWVPGTDDRQWPRAGGSRPEDDAGADRQGPVRRIVCVEGFPRLLGQPADKAQAAQRGPAPEIYQEVHTGHPSTGEAARGAARRGGADRLSAANGRRAGRRVVAADPDAGGARQPDEAGPREAGAGGAGADGQPGAARVRQGHRHRRRAGRSGHRHGDRGKEANHPRERGAGVLRGARDAG